MNILFWGASNNNGIFSNFYPSPITINDKIWPTVEHYFQAMKSSDLSDQESIRLASTPLKAKQLGRNVKLRSDWDSVRYNVMKQGLRAKFTLDSNKKALLDTGDSLIFETSPFDKIWGTGSRDENGPGLNLLGKALMEIRRELVENITL